MSKHSFLAFDLGAESGRSILGELEDGKLSIRELNRFPTGTVNIRGRLHWNIVQLFERMKEGLRIAMSEVEGGPESIGVDTWGVDYVLLAPDGTLLGLPYGYRDDRTEDAMDQFFQRVPKERVYELTGIQFMRFNSLFQVFAGMRDCQELVGIAKKLLFMPDAFNYLFSGSTTTEFTIASTSQMINPLKMDWDDELVAALGIRKDLLPTLIPTGSVIGEIGPEVQRETGAGPVKVVATAGHDTGSAVAAAPGQGSDWAFISSGTWSLMGLVSDQPILTELAGRYQLSNEGGVGNTFRVLKNIMGLWLIQQSRKAWTKEKTYDYGELARMAAESTPFRSLVDPDYSGFINPPDMPEAIQQFCRETGQPVPETPAQVTRCIMESLAFKYRMVLEQLRETSPSGEINRIHTFGGGIQNELLCRFTADACNVPVIAGPIEATAIGNILVQAMALGYLNSPTEIRDVVRRSFPMKTFEPQESEQWNGAYARFRALVRS